jgi:hypothetical protein
LRQRSLVGQPGAKYGTLAAWKHDWDLQRNGRVTFLGDASRKGGNLLARIFWSKDPAEEMPSANPENSEAAKPAPPAKPASPVTAKKLFLSLTLIPDQTQQRLIAAEDLLNALDSTDRKKAEYALSRLVLPLSFHPKLAAQLAAAQSAGQPITVTLQKKLLPRSGRPRAKAAALGHRVNQRKKPQNRLTGKRPKKAPRIKKLPPLTQVGDVGYYVHVAFDEPSKSSYTAPRALPIVEQSLISSSKSPSDVTTATTTTDSILASTTVTDRKHGAIGVDLNAFGLAYAGCDAQGNLLRDQDIFKPRRLKNFPERGRSGRKCRSDPSIPRLHRQPAKC